MVHIEQPEVGYLSDVLRTDNYSFAFPKNNEKADRIMEQYDINGTLVCVYYPDYMDWINASGWHLHFISEDRKKGGHVFDLSLENSK